MSDKISPELARMLGDPSVRPQSRVPVIVTLGPDAEAAEVTRAGLDVGRRFELLPAIAGTIAAADIEALAGLAAVKLIEYDAQVRAQNPD